MDRASDAYVLKEEQKNMNDCRGYYSSLQYQIYGSKSDRKPSAVQACATNEESGISL